MTEDDYYLVLYDPGISHILYLLCILTAKVVLHIDHSGKEAISPS